LFVGLLVDVFLVLRIMSRKESCNLGFSVTSTEYTWKLFKYWDM